MNENITNNTEVRNSENIDITLEGISHSMNFDPNLLVQEPLGGSWDTIKDYVGAISYNNQEQKHDFFSWKRLDLENIDLNEPANPEEALAGFLKTAAALKVEIPYSDGKPLDEDTLGKPWGQIQDTIAPEESQKDNKIMTLEELIVDVYPGLEMGIRDIREQLELAANDPEKFKKQFDQHSGDYRRWLSRAVPSAAVLVTVVVLGTGLASCSTPPVSSVESGNGNMPTVTLQQTAEAFTPTFTSTATEIPTEIPTSTPTETQEPTPTPLFDQGELAMFIENMERGDIVWDMVELQKIINGYDEKSSMTFIDYLSQEQAKIETTQDYGRIYNILEQIREYGELTDYILPQILKEVYPELNIVDIPEWPDKAEELIPEEVQSRLDNGDEYSSSSSNLLILQYYNQLFYFGNVGIGPMSIPGSIIANLKNPEIKLLTTLKLSTEGDSLNIFSVTVNNGGIFLFDLNSKNLKSVLGDGPQAAISNLENIMEGFGF